MNTVPISPSFHALINAASEAKEAKLSPLPPSSFLHVSSSSPPSAPAASSSSPLLSARSPLSSLNFRSPPSASSPSASRSPLPSASLTGMSILQMPPPATSAPSSSSSPSRDPDSPSPDGDASIQSSSSPDSPLSSLASLSHQSASSPHNHHHHHHRPPPTPPSSSPLVHPHTPLTSLLLPHSSTLAVRRNSTGGSGHGSGISKLLSSFKSRPKPSLQSTSSLSAFKAKKPLSSATAASSDASGGSSCHQCKSRRNYGDLTYCTSSLNKKNKAAVCRKKYCEHVPPQTHPSRRVLLAPTPPKTPDAFPPSAFLCRVQCLKKFYRETPASTASQAVWKCPSCRKICCCAACRRRELRGSGGSGHGAVGMDGGADEGHGVGDASTPPQGFLSPYGGQREAREDVVMSPVDSPPPPSSAFRGLLLSPAQTPALPPLPASALASREQRLAAEEAKEGGRPSSASPKGGSAPRTLLTVADSPALTALSYAVKKEKTASLYGGLLGLSAGLGRGGLGVVGGLNGHSMLNGHGRRGPTGGHRRVREEAGMNGEESDASNASSTSEDSDEEDEEEAEDGGMREAVEGSAAGGKERERDQGGGEEAAATSNGAAAATETMAILPSFALFYAVGQLPAVQEAVRGVMGRKEGSNAEKLRDIEELFYTHTERVSVEDVPLTL